MRSPLVEANGSVWFATDEGILYKVTLSSDGKVTEKATISLPDKGNAIISILEGKVFVTGGSGQGYIAVYSESDATEILSQKTDHQVRISMCILHRKKTMQICMWPSLTQTKR